MGKYPKLEVRMSEEEISGLRAYAESVGRTVPDIVRDAIRAVMGGEEASEVAKAIAARPGRSRAKEVKREEYSEEVQKMAAKLSQQAKEKQQSNKWLCLCGQVNFGVMCLRCRVSR